MAGNKYYIDKIPAASLISLHRSDTNSGEEPMSKQYNGREKRAKAKKQIKRKKKAAKTGNKAKS